VSLRCRYSIEFAADDDRIEKAARLAERGELTGFTNGDWERAQRLVSDVTREAKRDAEPRDAEEAARVQMARERRRNAEIASQRSPGIESRRAFQLAAERAEWDARLRAVGRAQHVGMPESDGNGAEPTDDGTEG